MRFYGSHANVQRTRKQVPSFVCAILRDQNSILGKSNGETMFSWLLIMRIKQPYYERIKRTFGCLRGAHGWGGGQRCGKFRIVTGGFHEAQTSIGRIEDDVEIGHEIRTEDTS